MRIPLLALALTGCLDANDPGALVPATVDQDPTLPQIELAGTRLHAEAFGNPAAPMVLALHGGPGRDYRSMLPLQRLADDGYYVVFWDQRGTGLSQRQEPGTYTADGYLEDLRLVIEHYSASPTQPVVLVGHSWGAMYATWFINEHGDYNGRVKGAILSEPGAFTNDQLDRFMDKVNATIDFTSEQLNDGTWSRQFMSAADHERADYLMALLAYGGLPSEAHDPNHPMPFWRYGTICSSELMKFVKDGFDWTTNLSGFQTKVLFLRGDRNTVVTLEHQQELAAAYPNAEIITMTDAGHEMVWEKPDEYLDYTRAYFREIGFAP